MAIGTDKQIFNSQETLKIRSSNGGRPKINRDLVLSLIKQGYSTNYITKTLKISSRAVRLIKKEAINTKAIKEVDIELLEKKNLDFDKELEGSVGISFLGWLKSKTVNYDRIFDFCLRVWESWDKPSITLLRDSTNPLGDQLCMKFMTVFGEDSKRIRDRKKLIRYFFRFIGRSDLCDRYLTMTVSRDPISIRDVPEITFNQFPIKLNAVIEEIERSLGFEYALAIKFKIITQMRTGSDSADRELLGIKVGSDTKSYIIVSGDQVRGKISSKANETWDLIWLASIKEDLLKVYKERRIGESFFKIDINKLRLSFGDLTEKVIGKRLKLHDLRKVSITWLYIMGIPLEIATSLNVGWKDLNTPKTYYLQFRKALKKSEKEEYRKNIPLWFKEGLEEYREE
jgi:integrase